MPAFISEDDIEQALIERLFGMDFETLHCYTDSHAELGVARVVDFDNPGNNELPVARTSTAQAAHTRSLP